MTVLEQVQSLSLENLPAITLLTGEDVGLYAHLRQALLAGLGYAPSDLTAAYFDLSQTPFAEAALDLVSLPFFADSKLVILDQLLDVTTAKKAYLDEAELKELEAYLLNPLETTKLVILAPGKLDGKRRLVKLLKRDALVLEAAPLGEQAVRDYVMGEAARRQLVLDQPALEALLAKSQLDIARLSQHLSLLEAYKGKGASISLSDIEAAIPKSLQDNIFDLTQLVLAGRVDEALSLVADLRLQGEDEVKLIAVMLGQLRLYLQVKLLHQQGRSGQTLVDALSDYTGRKVNPYQVKFAQRDSQPFGIGLLTTAISALIEADYQIKTGLYDKAYLFELALLKIAGART